MRGLVQRVVKGSNAVVSGSVLGEALRGVGEAFRYERQIGDVQSSKSTSPFATMILPLMLIVSYY